MDAHAEQEILSLLSKAKPNKRRLYVVALISSATTVVLMLLLNLAIKNNMPISYAEAKSIQSAVQAVAKAEKVKTDKIYKELKGTFNYYSISDLKKRDCAQILKYLHGRESARRE